MNEKQKFISKYLTKHMKNRPRQFGIEYMNTLADHEAKAEWAWRNKIQRLASKLNPKQKSFGNGYRKPIKDDMGVLQCLCTNAKPTSNGLGGHTCLKCNANWYH